MSILDPSSAFETISGAKDYSLNAIGIAGIYPHADGAIDFTDEVGNVHTAVPVFAGNVPPIRGKINITATTVTLLIGLN